MNAATLFTLPASIAAEIVAWLSAKDVCALAQVCLRDQSPPPRALAYADALRCRYAHLQTIPDALQCTQGAPLIFPHHISYILLITSRAVLSLPLRRCGLVTKMHCFHA